MSLVPAFEIGLWNTWIFMIWPLIQNITLRLISKEVYQRGGQPPDVKSSRTYKIFSYISMPLWLLATAYSIFLPLKLGTICFVVGLILFLLGMAMNIVATVNFIKTPMNQPVTGGAYRYSRHPIYVALVMIYLSVSIASASWAFILLTALFLVQVSLSVIEEERYCLERYGDSYREYMDRTRRWLGISKSEEN